MTNFSARTRSNGSDPTHSSVGAPTQIAAYYRSEAVRRCMTEYCEGVPEPPAALPAFGLAGFGGRQRLRLPDGAPVPVRLEQLGQLLEDGADVCRSLADRNGTLVQMDIDYVDAGEPGGIHLHSAACFDRIEPIYLATRGAFEAYGIPTLDVLSAHGYHLTTRIPSGTPLHAAMLEIGRLGAPLEAKYRAMGGEPWVRLGRAHDGAGRLLEHLTHRVIKGLAGTIELPLAVADIPHAGEGPIVCLDLSAYGDSLFERNIRCAFSSNQKACVSATGPFTINLPRRSRRPSYLLELRRNPASAARLAARVHTVIPTAPGDDARWVEDYRQGALARFHAWFDRGSHDPPETWPRTYDLLDLASLPRCVALPLAMPNPALLQPKWIRTVALGLWARGWHPRSIAGLIRSKYERDFGWGPTWYRYDAATRADFYVRVFCGAMACGIDTDFSCEWQAARNACARCNCGHDLSSYAHPRFD